MKTFCSFAIAATFFGMSSAHAASMMGDSFTFEFTDTSGSFGTLTGTAGSAGLDIDDALGSIQVDVNFVDDDTVDVAFYGSASYPLSYSLSSLDFLNGLASAPIAGVTFNRAGSNIDEFIGDTAIGQPSASEFVEPVISFTDTSFTADFSYFNDLLIADGPRLRYDISLATAPCAAANVGVAIRLRSAWSRRNG